MKLLQGVLFFALAAACAFTATDAQASKMRRHAAHRPVSFVSRDASIVVDADSGAVLQANKENEIRHPASLTKMMTLYLTFEALEKKKIKFTDSMPVTSYAAHQAPTNLNMEQGDRLRVEDAIKALVVRSANDAAVVLAEYIGGTESGFARMMTNKARMLGMKETYFKNASGLPDARQVTTARDLAVLGMALRKHFPQHYHYFDTREFTLNGVEYTTHNHVLERYRWADGLKTGYIRMSGFNLVTSAKKDGHMLVGVVLGGNTFRERDDRMIALLDDAFDRLSEGNAIRSVATLVKVPGTVAASAKEEMPEIEEPTVAATRQPEISEANAETQTAQGDTLEATSPIWGVQVGMFGNSKEALRAAKQAQKLASQDMQGSKVKVFSEKTAAVAVHRARIENLSEEQAHNACKHLAAQRASCFVYRTGV